MARILTYHLSMNNLLINLIGMGTQGTGAVNTSLNESSGAESNQEGFLNILKNILSESGNKQTLLTKLNEIQESGESSLAFVMSSLSNILVSMIPPGETNAPNPAFQTRLKLSKSMVPPEETDTPDEAAGQKISEISGEKIDQNGLDKTSLQNEKKNISGLLERMNFSALQEISVDRESEVSEKTSGGMVEPGASKENAIVIESEYVRMFHEEMGKLLSYLNGTAEIPIINNNASLQDTVEKIPIHNILASPIQQTMFRKHSNADNDTTNTMTTSSAADFSPKEIVEKNVFFLHGILEKEGNVNRDVTIGKGNSLQENNSIGVPFKSTEKLAQNTAQQFFDDRQGLDEKAGDGSKNEIHALIFNATKKYKEHFSEGKEFGNTVDSEITNIPAQKITGEIPQNDSLKTAIFQVKDNNMTFERGSFTSFVTDRIEKIVEQFSSRPSQTDMVVRLKLDDKETLLVGLKHDGQKIIVDVKASNDGLVNLIQTHKDDIARHLETKNIFTSIYVQPDGERNSERQNQSHNKKEERKKEAGTAFINILEATA